MSPKNIREHVTCTVVFISYEIHKGTYSNRPDKPPCIALQPILMRSLSAKGFVMALRAPLRSTRYALMSGTLMYMQYDVVHVSFVRLGTNEAAEVFFKAGKMPRGVEVGGRAVGHTHRFHSTDQSLCLKTSVRVKGNAAARLNFNVDIPVCKLQRPKSRGISRNGGESHSF